MADSVYLSKPWLKSYEPGVPEKMDFRKVCVSEFLEETTAKFPTNDALVFQGYKMNFQEMNDMVNSFAAKLTEFGIKKGDAVAILLPNSVPCVIAFYATLRIGAIVVMNNPLYSDVELEHQFNDSGSKALITIDLLANRMIDLRKKTGIKQIIYTSMGDYLPFPKSILFPLVAKKKGLAPKNGVNQANDLYKWKDCVATKAKPPKVTVGFEDIAMYQYTGGTTGVSKGVMLTHANLSCQTQQIRAWFPKFEMGTDVMLGALPYFHVFGMSTTMNFAVYMGWAQVLIPRPQPEPLLEAIKKFRPTFVPLVPTMYIGILAHPNLKNTDMSCIKGAFSGSAPLPVEVIKEFESLTGAAIVEGFGMTETTPVTHINPFAGGLRKPGTVGLPVTNTLAKIVDLEDGVTELPVGERGELIVSGPQIMLGYKGRPEETANTLKNGWIYTGDIAIMDKDGYFSIVDRKKDMIISGGYNVYPRDIDEVYYLHPKVQEACSIGIPDPKRGESVKLFIVLKEGVTSSQEEIIEFGKQHLAAYKLPVEVEFRTELPKTNVGKILRKELRAQEMEKRKNK
ncbi:MAG: long-chain fatty acid--CoA ligase [Deltaproteobacteria bacterium]|nr:long-chain fatty acid--CoA ligase [Deltaproteobacteria bacterium]